MSGEIDRIRRQTESVQEVLAATRTGDTAFDLLSEALDAFREQAVRLLEGARKRGLDVFDRHYQRIAQSDPPRYHTVYDRIDERLTRLLDSVLEAIPAAATRCWSTRAATRRRTTVVIRTRPRAIRKVDIARARHKRIFDDPVGQRLAANTAGQLFQTYSRDTGEIVNDISVPVYLGPEHWARCGSAGLCPFQAATEQGAAGAHPRPPPAERRRRVGRDAAGTGPAAHCGIAPLSPFLAYREKARPPRISAGSS